MLHNTEYINYNEISHTIYILYIYMFEVELKRV